MEIKKNIFKVQIRKNEMVVSNSKEQLHKNYFTNVIALQILVAKYYNDKSNKKLTEVYGKKMHKQIN